MKSILRLAVLAGAGCLATAAFAADLPEAAPMMTTPTVASSWDGFYAGFNLGYAQGNSDHIGATIGDMGMAGWLAGGQVGYNATVAAGLVLGLQGDLDWANVTGTYTGGPTITQTINWEGSLTAHLGFDGGAFMPYVLGGLAVANGNRDNGGTPENGTHIGYTVGVGAAAKVSDNASIFGEVRYNNFGSHIYTTLPTNPQVALTSTEVRVGLNFHM